MLLLKFRNNKFKMLKSGIILYFNKKKKHRMTQLYPAFCEYTFYLYYKIYKDMKVILHWAEK